MARLLRERGASESCVVVSEDEELDGTALPLEEALGAVLHSFYGSLISCVPGRLAVYSGEAPNQTTTLLERTQ